MTEPAKVPIPNRLSPEEITQLAMGMVEGTTFFTNNGEGIRLSFGVMIALVDWTDAAEFVGGFYESMEKALPRSINGLPMFMSMRVLHRDDLEPLDRKVQEYKSARADFAKGTA